MIVKKINAKIIKNSKGCPAIYACINGSCAAAPSGTSTGSAEAVELPAKIAVKKLGLIKKNLIGRNVSDVDSVLIKIAGLQKKRLGTNMTTALSMAACRAADRDVYRYVSKLSGRRPKMPMLMFNMIEGGLHAENKLSIQEFLMIPEEKIFSAAMASGKEIYSELGLLIKKRYGKSHLGMEAGYQPPLKITQEALELLMTASEKTGRKIKICMDCAASSFQKSGKYFIDGIWLDRGRLLDYYRELVLQYPIASVEDPFEEKDWSSFEKITKMLGKRIMIVGDDLTATNPVLIKKAAKMKACNAVIIKINQIGTVSEAVNAVKIAQKNKMKVIVSHRSGETKDSFIADFAAGVAADFIKSGAPATPWRMSKYNRLLRIGI
jgi:enolase